MVSLVKACIRIWIHNEQPVVGLRPTRTVSVIRVYRHGRLGAESDIGK